MYSYRLLSKHLKLCPTYEEEFLQLLFNKSVYVEHNIL